jgi:hypothetical protein
MLKHYKLDESNEIARVEYSWDDFGMAVVIDYVDVHQCNACLLKCAVTDQFEHGFA